MEREPGLWHSDTQSLIEPRRVDTILRLQPYRIAPLCGIIEAFNCLDVAVTAIVRVQAPPLTPTAEAQSRYQPVGFSILFEPRSHPSPQEHRLEWTAW